MKNLFRPLLLSFIFLLFSNLHAQNNSDRSFWNKLFIPSVQMGYIDHNSPVISSGLIIQTSLEYRNSKNMLYRLNYDDFGGRINLHNNSGYSSYSGRIPLSELIAGLGYRKTFNKHNIFAVVQSGIRFYELPVVENKNNSLIINQVDRTIVPIRYTLGYEYEIFENAFLNIETFVGHFASPKDYWNNIKPFWGVTLGVSTNLL